MEPELHVPDIRPVQKMDLFQPAWSPTCSCGWDPGGVMSERNARSAAKQHADAKNKREATIKPSGFCRLHNFVNCWHCQEAPQEAGPVGPPHPGRG